jgi:hypothetical protein
MTYAAAGLLVLCTLAALAPVAAANPVGDCNGVVVNSQFTGVCVIHNCISSPSGTGLVVYVNGNPGRCIGI